MSELSISQLGLKMLIDNFLKLQRVIFGMSGFDLFATGQIWQRPYITICFLLILCSFLPGLILFCIENMGNMDVFTSSLVSLMALMLAIFKISMLIYYRSSFEQFIRNFRQMLTVVGNQNAEYAIIIVEENHREQFISGLYKNIFLVALAACNGLPIFQVLYSYLRTGQVKAYSLPYPSKYPWSTQCMLNYLLTYMCGLCTGFSVVLPTIGIDTLFCSFGHNLCALFKVAQKKMVQLDGYTQNDVQNQLIEVIRLHQVILQMCNNLNTCYQPLICIQFLISSMQLCVVGFQVSSAFDQLMVVYYMALFMALLLQVFIYCYCGEYLRTESIKFAWAIYDSTWYDGKSGSIKRMLLLSLMRAQRGSQIDGYFFIANMSTFASIGQAATSYITLLRSMS